MFLLYIWSNLKQFDREETKVNTLGGIEGAIVWQDKVFVSSSSLHLYFSYIYILFFLQIYIYIL
jgi:hypothetical protein